jgi:hypothetical protein
MLGEIEWLYSRIVDRCPAMPTSEMGSFASLSPCSPHVWFAVNLGHGFLLQGVGLGAIRGLFFWQELSPSSCLNSGACGNEMILDPPDSLYGLA